MPSSAREPADHSREVMVCLGLVFLTLAVFWPTIRYDFLNYDDNAYVLANPHVLTGLTWANIGWAFGSTAASNWHPLTWMSHMLDCQLYGRWAGGHHLTNLLFHLANTLLLFRLLQRMTGAFWRSAFVAALFAIHPVHIESVAWVAERKDVLSAFFFILTLGLYVRYAESAGSGKAAPARKHYAPRTTPHAPLSPLPPSVYYCLSLACFALGLMSKPMLVTTPLLLLLLDYWPLARLSFAVRDAGIRPAESKAQRSKSAATALAPAFQPTTLPRLLMEKLPFLALAIASSLATVWAQNKGGAMLTLEGFPLGLRMANALVSYVRYVGKLLWPNHLAVFYPHPVHWPAWQVAAAGLLLFAASIAAIRLAWRAPYLFTGWFWFLAALVPVIGLVQVGSQAMADRYMYLPTIGLLVAIAWGVPTIFPARPRRQALAIGGLILLGATTICSAIQIRYWENGETLFTHAIRVTHNNSVAYNNLGAALVQQERLDEAVAAFTESLRLDPHSSIGHANLGGVLRQQGKSEAAAAHFEAALQIHPEDVQVQNDLANLLDSLGHPDAAVPHYMAALRLNPDLAGTHYNFAGRLPALGRLGEAVTHYQTAIRLQPGNASAHYNLAYTLAKLGQPKEAQAEYLAAIQQDPNHTGARNNLGNLLLRMGKPEEAVAQFEALLARDPAAAEAHCSLGKALLSLGKPEQALPHLREAVRLNPSLLPALNSLAWFLATHPRADLRDGKQAVQLAERLCQLTNHRQPGALATLAAAYAEAGDYAKAVQTAEVAHELALAAQNTELAAALDKRLSLYHSNRPFHESPTH